MNIILSSKSPRRTEILTLANIKHTVITTDVQEIIDNTLTPYQVVESLSYQKASPVALKYPNDLVIGADTIVCIDNKILGKPKDYNDAFNMLKLLSNNIHEVITGVSLFYKDRSLTFHEITKVVFDKMTDVEIHEYIEKENVFDKAGSYAIQGMVCKYIKKIDGDYYNVVGLPIARLNKEIKEFTNEE